MSLSPELIVQLIAYLVIIVVFSMKLATKNELKEKVKDRDDKIKTVYEKLDTHKKDCSETYVRKDICCQMHEHTKDSVKKIDDDAKAFRHEILNTVQKIYLTLEAQTEKFETQNEKINELKELILKK